MVDKLAKRYVVTLLSLHSETRTSGGPDLDMKKQRLHSCWQFFYGNSMSRCSNVDPMRNFKMTSTCAGKIFFILWVPVFGIYHKLWAPISESLRILAVTILSLCKIWDLQALGQSSCRNSNTKQHLHKGTWKHHIVIQNFTKTLIWPEFACPNNQQLQSSQE